MTNFNEYEQSTSEASSAGKIKMQEIIHANLSQSMAVVEQVQSQTIRDRIVRGAALDFKAVLPESDKLPPQIAIVADGESKLHRNALSQVSDKADVPFRFVNSLIGRGAWGAPLRRIISAKFFQKETARAICFVQSITKHAVFFPTVTADLNKSEAESAIEAYNSPDVVNLPPGNSIYRLSNAVSWIAQAAEIEPERALELNKIAGNLIPRVESVKAAEV